MLFNNRIQGSLLLAWIFSMYSNKQNAKVLAKGFFTSLGATPSKSLLYVRRLPNCLMMGFSLWLASLL